MTGLLRTPRLWSYMSGLLALVFVSLLAYSHNRASRIKELIESLKSGEPEVAQSAVTGLGQMGSDILPHLIPSLKEMNSGARAHAAAALRRVNSAVPALVVVLGDEDFAMRAAAAEVLGKMGSDAREAVPTLITAIDDEDESVSRAAKVALGEIRDLRAVDPLISTFKRRPPGRSPVEDAAEDALAKMCPPAINALTAALKSEVSGVRESSARVLGKAGPAAREATPALIAALGDADEGTRRAVKLALGEIGDPRAVDPLIASFYRDSSSDDSAQVALGKIGGGAVGPLIAKLEEERGKRAEIRELSVSALGHIGPAARDATTPLIALLNGLKEEDGGTRRQAIWSLGRIRDERAVAPLIALLKQKAPAKGVTPENIIRALGEIGPAAKEATPLLWPRVWEDNLHGDAVAALKKISPESEDKIIYEERAYASLENAVSIDLLPPALVVNLTGDDGYPIKTVVAFKWRLTKRRPGVTFCSIVRLDKGNDPFDGGNTLDFPAGSEEQLTTPLRYGEYYGVPFDWGVQVTACRDAGARCDKRKPCVGRAFKRSQRLSSL